MWCTFNSGWVCFASNDDRYNEIRVVIYHFPKLLVELKAKAKKGNVCPQRNVHFHPRYWGGQYWEASLFTLSLYGIYKGSARYNALLHTTYCMVIKNIDWWLWTLILISTYRRWVCSKGHCPEDVRQSQRAEYFKSLKVKMTNICLNTPSTFQKLKHLRKIEVGVSIH